MNLEEIPLTDPDFDPTTVPFVAKLVSGELPGVIVNQSDADALKPLEGNGRTLFTKAGLVMVPTSLGAALFNPDIVKVRDIEKMDAAGTLADTFPSVSEVAVGSPSSDTEPQPRPPIPFGEPSGQPASAVPPLPAGAQRGVQKGRIANLTLPNRPPTQTGSPTSGLLGRLRAPVT